MNIFISLCCLYGGGGGGHIWYVCASGLCNNHINKATKKKEKLGLSEIVTVPIKSTVE